MLRNIASPRRSRSKLGAAAVLAIVACATFGPTGASAAAIEPSGSAPKDALLILVGWEASGEIPAAPVDKTVDEVRDAILRGSSLFDTMSRGMFPGWEVPTTVGPLTISAPTSTACEGAFRREIADAADIKAYLQGIDLGEFDQTIYYFANPRHECREGVANIGGRRVWLIGSTGRTTILHELGHTLGLGHANGLTCRDANGNRVQLNGNCTISEYGDFNSIMGYGEGSYAAPHQAALGWLPGKVLNIIPIAGTYTLSPIEVDAPTLALRVVDPPNILWFEYRQPLGIDFREGGVVVHREISPEDPTTSVLSMSVKPFFTGEAMNVGETWVNPVGHTRVRLDSEGALGAQLTFFAPPPPAPKGVPDVRGLLLAPATNELTTAGYTVGTTTFVLDASCEFIGEVMSQTPTAGTAAPAGTAVKLTVGKKPSKCIVD